MGIYVKFYHDHSPNMVLSHDPKQQISKNCIFRLILYQISGKLPTVWGELAQEQKSYRQKPSAKRVKFLKSYITDI